MNSAEQDRQTLRRIALQLIALANVAERASLRSLPIRFLLFWLLRPAEAYARNLVADALRDLGAQADLPASSVDAIAPMILGKHGNRACDVLRLAVTFQMMADLVEALGELVVAPTKSQGAGASPRSCEESLPCRSNRKQLRERVQVALAVMPIACAIRCARAPPRPYAPPPA